MLQLSLKCWNSTFNARGPRPIIVVVKLVSVKIYVAAVEALVQKDRQDETQFTTKILMVFWVSSPVEMLMYFSAGFFLESHPLYDQTQGSGAVFFLTLRITLIYCQKEN
jgi:hypothetical protein